MSLRSLAKMPARLGLQSTMGTSYRSRERIGHTHEGITSIRRSTCRQTISPTLPRYILFSPFPHPLSCAQTGNEGSYPAIDLLQSVRRWRRQALLAPAFTTCQDPPPLAQYESSGHWAMLGMNSFPEIGRRCTGSRWNAS